jgi:hypothetical protein
MFDFLELAQSSRWLLERALNDNNNENDDDDFAKLDHSNDNNNNNNIRVGAGEAAFAADATSYYDGAITRPFLSKSSEAELYLLATNFLLCKCQVKSRKRTHMHTVPSISVGIHPSIHHSHLHSISFHFYLSIYFKNSKNKKQRQTSPW